MHTQELTKHPKQHMVDKAIDSLKKEASDMINTIHQSIVINDVDTVSKLPEEIFVNYFLPMFIGEYKDNGKRTTEWISVAGTPASPVNIIDIHGIILYKVPGLINTSSLIKKGSDSILQVIKQYSLYKDHPIYNENEYLNSSLNNVLDSSVAKNEKELWFNILTRYNLIDTRKENAVIKNDKNNIDDFIDYE